MSKASAEILGQRLLRLIGETAFGFDDVQIPVTLSIGIAAVDEVHVADHDIETSPGIARSKETPAVGSIVDPFGQVGNASSITSEFSVFEGSRSGELIDRFQAASENLLGLARQRVAQAKADGKGRLVG